MGVPIVPYGIIIIIIKIIIIILIYMAQIQLYSFQMRLTYIPVYNTNEYNNNRKIKSNFTYKIKLT